MPPRRRHDIDALRVIAFGLLILYHVGMVYVAEWGYHAKSEYQTTWLQWPMIALNRWRMPLLFAISGIALALALPRRGTFALAVSRTWRLLLPLAFGMLAVVPIQAYCEALGNGAIAPGFGAFLARYLQLQPWPGGGWSGAEYGVTWNHLWYLAYVLVYSLAVLALLPLAGRIIPAWRPASWTRTATVGLILLPATCSFLLLVLLMPLFPENHALMGDWYAHANYFAVFVFGFVLAWRDGFRDHLCRLRWPLLGIAVTAMAIELLLRAAGRQPDPIDLPAAMLALPWGKIERAARALYGWTALLAALGWGAALLDRPFRWLPYAREAVYPWYILHQSLIVPLAFWLAPLQFGPVLEPVLVLGGTVIGCALLYEGPIRRVGVLRPLFGLAPNRRSKPAVDAAAASPAG